MARTKTRTKMSTKKKLSAVIAAVLCVALLIGGAFAWTDFSQNFINRFRGGVTPDALLHDDFEPWINKDVYVENTGEQDLIVRVKFNEFLQIGNDFIVGSNPNDKDTWVTHKYNATNCEICDLETHDYFKWSMTGASKTYLHGTSEQGNDDWSSHNIEDENDIGPNGMMFGKTADASPIMTMAEWNASDKTASCWILDSDGWAYWSQALAPGAATNLLLDNVELIQKPDDNFYYAIDVIMNAANKTEYQKLYPGASEEGKNLIDDLADKSIDKLLDKAIEKAKDALKDAENNPGKYTPESISDLENALNDAIDVRDNKDSSDADKQGAIDGINSKLPLEEAELDIPATSVSIDNGDLTMNIGDTEQINITINPANSTDKPVYSTSDDSVVTVDPETGEITAVGGGTATITVTVGDKTASITITIALELKEPYATDPSYTPSRGDYKDRIALNFNGASPNDPPEVRTTTLEDAEFGYEYSIPLADLLADQTLDYSKLNITVTNASDFDNDTTGKVFVRDGKLVCEYIPSYDECASAPKFVNVVLPMNITLECEGAEVDFTLNLKLYGGFTPYDPW